MRIFRQALSTKTTKRLYNKNPIWLYNRGYILTDYLRAGLPSKIYFHAFPEPISGYEIAKRIYKQPLTAHVYKNSDKMVNDVYLTETPKGLHSNVEPLLNEIVKDLAGKNIMLTKTEKIELFKFLNTTFRQYVDIKEPYPEGDINAYVFLTSRLGHMVFAKMSVNNVKKYENSLPIGMPLSSYINTMINNLPKDKAEDRRKAQKEINEIQLSDRLLQKLNFFIPEEFKVFLSLTEIFESLKKQREE